MRLRELRQNLAKDTNNDVQGHKLNDELCREQAIVELDKLGVDKWTNVQLREEMQSRLEPQALRILNCFQTVDQILNLPLEEKMDEDVMMPIFHDFNWDPYLEILHTEREYVEQCINAQAHRPESQPRFLHLKRKAVDTLLRFHANGTSQRSSDNDGEDVFGSGPPPSDNQSRNSQILLRKFQTLNICRSALIRKELGFSILTLRSTVNGAGRGVFVEGSAPEGSLIAFQPGEIWPKEHILKKDADAIQHFEGDGDCHVSLRFDDYVADSRNSPVTVLTQYGSLNPWAIGHMVNHPADKVMPNCQSAMFDYTDRMALGDLVRYIPNYYARQPGWQSMFFYPEPLVMHGLSLVTRRDVHDEELFYDYRLQSHDAPSWYSPVHFGDESIDNQQLVFFRDDWRK